MPGPSVSVITVLGYPSEPRQPLTPRPSMQLLGMRWTNATDVQGSTCIVQLYSIRHHWTNLLPAWSPGQPAIPGAPHQLTVTPCSAIDCWPSATLGLKLQVGSLSFSEKPESRLPRHNKQAREKPKGPPKFLMRCPSGEAVTQRCRFLAPPPRVNGQRRNQRDSRPRASFLGQVQ